MNPEDQNANPAEVFASSEVEQLLASAAQENPGAEAPAAVAVPGEALPYDFRNPMMLPPAEMRKLRLHQEEFIKGLAARLSVHLRLEFLLKMTGLRTITYQKLAESWENPSHLTLFKLEPLRGVSVIEISPRLGMSMVDRLMGGPGHPPETIGELSEIEKALLEQTVQMVLVEWCANWAKFKELKPVLLGCESNGRFIQAAPTETMMLVIVLEGAIGECSGKIQIGLPFAPLESMIRQLNQGNESAASVGRTAAPASNWNAGFNDLNVPVTAELEGLELTVGELIALKIGDVLPLTPNCVEQVNVRLGELLKFNGRPGMIDGHWAVELTQVIKA